MTEKNEKRLSMRQELRKAAEGRLVKIKVEAGNAVDDIALREGLIWQDLVKAISDGSHKTAEHNLVTQLTNKAEADLLALWNDQQDLDLRDKDAGD